MPVLNFGDTDSKLILRPYQEAMVQASLDAIGRGVQRWLAVAATGTGKTPTFAGLVRELSDDPASTFLILAHRRELLYQIRDTFSWAVPNLSCDIHSGEMKAQPGTRVVAASVQSIGTHAVHSLLKWLSPTMIIVDEAHHAAAPTYQNVFRNAGCYDSPGTMLMGVTATPHRLDNKALVGNSDKAIFEELVYRYDITSAIRDGWLVDLRGYRCGANFDLSEVKTRAGDYVQDQLEKVMNTDPVNELAFRSWETVAKDRQTIVFCAGVDHARSVADVFKAQGIEAEAIYGDMPMTEREGAIRRFRSGKTQVLTNMDILTEGFDARECAAVVMLRPTKSWSLFAQMVGRGLRPLPGIIDGVETSQARRNAISCSKKNDCIVIDIVGNVAGHDISEAKSGRGSPSLQALVGLPENLDIEGRTITEACLEFDELPEAVKAAAFAKGRTSFQGLSAVLTQVEMLSDLGVPAEAIDGGATFYWMKTGELSYTVELGLYELHHRRAVLTGDLIGNWHAELHARHKLTGEESVKSAVDVRNSDKPPFLAAEHWLRSNLSANVLSLVHRDAAWRKAAPTDAQLAVLRDFGIDESILSTLDRGHASAMISRMRRDS